MLLSGTFDPVTSPSGARLAAQMLSKGYLYEFPAEAHDLLLNNSCALNLVYRFMKDPVKPLDPCLEHLSGPIFELR